MHLDGDALVIDGARYSEDAIRALLVEAESAAHWRQVADERATIIRVARERLYDAHGRDGHYVYQVILAVGKILRREVSHEPDH
jgi:hypothetical protein